MLMHRFEFSRLSCQVRAMSVNDGTGAIVRLFIETLSLVGKVLKKEPETTGCHGAGFRRCTSDTLLQRSGDGSTLSSQ